MFKKHVHNGKILINIKRKGLDTKSCVCKGKTVKYVNLISVYQHVEKEGNPSKQ